MIRCSAKHTKYDPIDFRCPKCGIGPEGGGLVIEYPDEEAHEECGKMHVNDECRCHACGYVGSGSAVARALKKQDNMETCPCCKGRGMVPVKDCAEDD
jgi:hypothetical protein